MAVPLPKTDQQLDEDEWVIVKRNARRERHQLEMRREMNEVYKEGQALKQAGRLLKAEEA